MEVDEAASHIKELVDPDANIIWGSAFNNELEGKIRVSVVATGIEADASVMPEPARVFSFPTARKSEDIIRTPEPVIAPAPVPEPDPVAEAAPALETAAEAESETVAESDAPLVLDAPESEAVAEASAEDTEFAELVLDTQSVIEEPIASNPVPPTYDDSEDVGEEAAPRRRWLVSEEETPEAKPAPGGATLFERMSNIARGQAKAEPDTGAKTDPLDIPRFLNRQNNQ